MVAQSGFSSLIRRRGAGEGPSAFLYKNINLPYFLQSISRAGAVLFAVSAKWIEKLHAG